MSSAYSAYNKWWKWKCSKYYWIKKQVRVEPFRLHPSLKVSQHGSHGVKNTILEGVSTVFKFELYVNNNQYSIINIRGTKMLQQKITQTTLVSSTKKSGEKNINK